MPAIQVARTDTFEQQRVKINQIGEQIFNVTAGGSDLSTGNLKLGDGSLSSPSLSFINEGSLGLYRQDVGTIGYVYSNKLLYTLSQTGFLSYRDFKIRQNTLQNSDVAITNSGQLYDPGSYSNIVLTGGTGESATANFVVSPFSGVESQGVGYNPGNFTNIPLVGGSTSSRSFVDFTVDSLTLNISNNGSGYAPGNYTNVPLVTVTGSGSGALADVSVTGGFTYNGVITGGSGYSDGTTFSVPLYNNPTTIFSVTVSGDGVGTPFEYLIDGSTQPTLNLIAGNTYRFDTSDSSNLNHSFFLRAVGGGFTPSGISQITVGTSGSQGSFFDVVIDPNYDLTTLEYSCIFHQTMGGDINFSTGTLGVYGSGATADFEVSGGSVTSINFDLTGSGYKSGDILVVSQVDIGPGTGFEFLINSIDNDGIISGISIVNSGSGYVVDDELTINAADIGGTGQDVAFLVTSDPGTIKNLSFVSSALDYQVGDILTIPAPVTGVSVTLVGSDGGATTPETFFVVPDISNIVVGSTVIQTSGTGSLNGLQDTLVTSVDYDNNIVTIDVDPDLSGSATLSFIPPYGDATLDFTYTIDKVGFVESIDINNPGIGYFLGDVLSVNPLDLVQPITYYVKAINVQHLEFSSSTIVSGTFNVGDRIKTLDGTPTSVTIDSYTTIITGNQETYSNISPISTSGNGIGETFTISRDSAGEITSVIPDQVGFFYSIGDTVTISGADVGGSTPTDDIVVTISNATQSPSAEIYQVLETGGFTEKIVVDDISFIDLQAFVIDATTNPQYTILTASASGTKIVYSLSEDIGVNNVLSNITLLSGNTYLFDTSDSSNSGHNFNISEYPGGIWGSSLIENVTTTVDLNVTSSVITVNSTTNIVAGMEVLVTSGTGSLPANTIVTSVDSSTQLTLSNNPTANGSSTLTFRGVPYEDGVSVDANQITVKVTDLTPSPLYYYDSNETSVDNADAGGIPGIESQITIDTNNPKVFGSGFTLNVVSVSSIDAVNLSVATGQLNSVSINTGEIVSSKLSVNGDTNSSTVTTNSLSTDLISSTNLSITGSSVSFDGPNVTIGPVSITNSSGNITTSGIIKSTNTFSSNDRLLITDNNISSVAGFNIELQPAANQVLKVVSSGAIVIPSGSTSQRPTTLAENGSIRYNTTTGQYEGYSATTSSWSSLGGVRDIDGNTTILAELTVGANDNTLWFYNDGINTVKFTPSHLEFVNQKKIRSLNVNAPIYTNWSSNTPVSVGDFLKYKNNLYEVTVSGTTGTTGSEPVHTSGSLPNGTAELTWYSLAVADLTLEDISILRIGPSSNLPVSINNDLRLSQNVISTDVSDLLIRPNSGKKVKIDCPTSLVIPSGFDTDRGVPEKGSIRFSDTSLQFEGYDGSNWGSLGGVKDVNQNTYIIPETSPGSDEDILYFYNDNNNTIQLTTNSLDFYSIDTIRSVVSDELEITASRITFDDGTSTLDNTATDRTFLHTTKQYFDLGLSSGINNDPVLRLDDQGDVYLNIGFGTGVFDGVKVFDGDLKEFELADVRILTEKITLTKGTSNTGSSELYAVSTNAGCKTTVIAVNPTSGDKEFIEFGVLDDGTDVFHTEYGNIRTGAQLIIPTFEVTGSNIVRINIELGANVNPTESVNITVVSNVTKK